MCKFSSKSGGGVPFQPLGDLTWNDPTESVTAMLNELGWHSLSKRREDARLILFYKIINNLAKVPNEHILVKSYEITLDKHYCSYMLMIN